MRIIVEGLALPAGKMSKIWRLVYGDILYSHHWRSGVCLPVPTEEYLGAYVFAGRDFSERRHFNRMAAC